MSVSIDRFYRIWQFLKDNPYPETNAALKGQAIDYNGTYDLYRNILKFSEDKLTLSFPKDISLVDAALQAREKQWKFFAKVLVPGSYAYNTNDMDLFRQMTVDWSSTVRTFKDTILRSTNAFYLDDIDVDLAIKGFGIDFVNKDTLDNTIQRQLFLLALCDLYKIKGTPKSITKALSFAYVRNAVIREYWIERNPRTYRQLRVRGVATGRNEQTLNTEDGKYEFVGNPDHYTDTYLTWQNFENALFDIAEPHWWYKTNEILDIDYDPNTILKLPSLTPYFGIDFYPNIERYNILISILEKILSDQLNSIISGDKNLLPAELGVSGLNQDMSERTLWVTGYNKPLTMVETYLAFAYAQIRYDEYLQYTDLKNFLESHGVTGISSYSYPFAYQELINWCWDNRNTSVQGLVTIDAVVKKYVKGKSNYYCSTNELVKWWLAKSPSNWWNSANDNNVPAIFFSLDYSFQFQPDRRDTTLDEILFYNGIRKLDYKTPPFEYFETINDADTLRNTFTTRFEYDNSFKSYHQSNRNNLYLPTEFDAQTEFKNTYYDYISWLPISGYYDTETHDGSNIVPNYFGKYPKSVQWNWGIDKENLYICKSPGKWIKTIVERDWDIGEAPLDPTSPAPAGVAGPNQIGYQFYYQHYMYKYVATNTWVRYIVEIDWPYCEAPISSDGHIKSTSDISHYTIKAKVSTTIADQYLNHKDDIVNTIFTITIDPLSSSSTTKQFDVTQLESYIETNRLTLQSSGYLIKDFSYYYENSYLYIRSTEYNTNKVVWVRKVFASNWDISDNGDKMFVGDYRYPNLDLTNRYDAERILRGKFVLTYDELAALPGTTNDGEMLVATANPRTYFYNTITSTWDVSPTNRINDINLGINNALIEWIDTAAETEEDYAGLADKFLNTLSTYVKIQFQDPDFDIAGIYKTISNSGLHKNLINFFKPKRARLLFFAVNAEFDDRLFNSIILDEVPAATKLIQTVNDYIPRNDGIMIVDNHGLYSDAYHEDDVTKSLTIPIDPVYGEAVYYVNGFKDQRVNGFYFSRPDLGSNYYLNYSNVCLTNISNEEKIYDLWNEWIFALRKPNLHWCDALYVNYSTSVTGGQWVTKDFDPITSSSSSSETTGSVILVGTLTINDLRECDITKSIYMDRYDIGKINQWNEKHPRPEPMIDGLPFSSSSSYPEHTQEKTLRTESRSLRHWTPALCTDLVNFRRIFPVAQEYWWSSSSSYPSPSWWIAAGYPESIEGDRIGSYNGDPRNPGTNEFNYSLWAKNYPYYDNNMLEKNMQIHDAATSPIGMRDTANALQQQVSSNYNDPNTGVPVWWIGNPLSYISGPVFHRPVYIAIQHTINDCYPCPDVSKCCDYYDIGCRHDGPTNPIVARWEPDPIGSSSSGSGGGVWTSSQYTEYSLKELQYDEFTTHHRLDGFITNLDDIINPDAPIPNQITVREYWDSEPSWAMNLTNPGDTYCTECDEPLFTPDIAVFSIPEEWKLSGVYHNTIEASNFSDISFNGTWEASASMVSATGNNDFPIGYKKQSDPTNFELVHLYDIDSGYYYWELRQNTGSWVVQLRSELKKKLHSLDEIVDENTGNWRVEQGHFLNGDDIDIVDDRWADTSLGPIDFIDKDKEDIAQVIVDGSFKTSSWVSFAISSYNKPLNSPYYEGAKGVVGQVNFEPLTVSDGDLYLCVLADPITSTYVWRVAHNFEFDWSTISESYIRPDSSNNYYGYYYRNGYMYLFVNTLQYVGWVRYTATPSIPAGDLSSYYSGNWNLSDIINTAYRYVSSTDVLPNPEASSDELFVCGNMVPYKETYDGIRRIQGEVNCVCHVEDEVEISVYSYYQDDLGDYIRIKTTTPASTNGILDYTVVGGIISAASINTPGSGYTNGIYLLPVSNGTGGYLKYTVAGGVITVVSVEIPGTEYNDGVHSIGPSHTRVEHRYISKLYEGLLPATFDEVTFTPEDHYLLKNYIPFFIPNEPNKATWEQDGSDYYSRILVPPGEWINPDAGIPIIDVTPISKDFGILELWDDASQVFQVKNVGEGILSGVVTFGAVEPFTSLTAPTYSLAKDEIKNITINFKPTSVAIFNDVAHFSGGGGENVSLVGEGIALTTRDSRVTEDDQIRITEDALSNRIVQ